MEILSPLQTKGNAFSEITKTKIGQLQNRAESGNFQDQEELKKLAKQFESIFVNLLMKSMRETVPKEGMLSSFSMDMYQSMFDEEVATVMSESPGKGLGLADVLYTQLNRMYPDTPDTEKAPADTGSPSKFSQATPSAQEKSPEKNQ